MYIPKNFLTTDKEEIIAFMKQFSFATIITAKNNIPSATHLPFTISTKEDRIILVSHFAKANSQWADIEANKVLVIFTEPHAYISPKHYDKELSVPTWNYISVHAYGQGQIITDTAQSFDVLEAMIMNHDITYKQQWDNLPQDFKLKMLNGIVPFEIIVNDLQASKKLSQNKTAIEQQRIINTLSNSNSDNERAIADFMKRIRQSNQEIPPGDPGYANNQVTT